jgi:hypothetical protein
MLKKEVIDLIGAERMKWAKTDLQKLRVTLSNIAKALAGDVEAAGAAIRDFMLDGHFVDGKDAFGVCLAIVAAQALAGDNPITVHEREPDLTTAPEVAKTDGAQTQYYSTENGETPTTA